MIGDLRTPFYESDIMLDQMYRLTFSLHQLEDEKPIKDLPVFKCGDIIAFFTNKRIVCSYIPKAFGSFDSISGFEFVSYKSVQRFSLISDTHSHNHTLDIIVSDDVTISFSLSDLHKATTISRLIGKNSI